MPELTILHKRTLGDLLLELDDSVFGGQIVPSADSPHVQALLAEINAGAPVKIEQRDDHLGLYGWPADGVRARIEADGGAIRFGWRLREWPDILLTAEYHAVWEEPDGTLVDIAPSIVEDTVTLFAPDDTDPPPDLRHRVLHVSPDRSQEIADRIASLKPSQRMYEERRAAKAGKSLHDWIGAKSFTDTLPEAIPAFIAACDAFSAKLARLPNLIELRPDDFDEADEGEWHPDWETEQAGDKLVDWDMARQERMMDIEEGMDALGLMDARLTGESPSEI
jgi:hypothetical protein